MLGPWSLAIVRSSSRKAVVGSVPATPKRAVEKRWKRSRFPALMPFRADFVGVWWRGFARGGGPYVLGDSRPGNRGDRRDEAFGEGRGGRCSPQRQHRPARR